ncbi:MAG: hypothetical protein P8L71_01515 [Flavobacteriales bacterium]|nr:hypothetical protein [Flavobacteriales bacterium]
MASSLSDDNIVWFENDGDGSFDNDDFVRVGISRNHD